jgi:hypothetical protein
MAVFTDLHIPDTNQKWYSIEFAARVGLLMPARASKQKQIHEELMQQTEISYRGVLKQLERKSGRKFSGLPSTEKSHLRPGIGIEI